MLPFHQRPIRNYERGKKYGGVSTPYHWQRKDSGWRIGFGGSSFLVAEGSGFSQSHGMQLLRQLEDDWRLRLKARRPKRRAI